MAELLLQARQQQCPELCGSLRLWPGRLCVLCFWHRCQRTEAAWPLVPKAATQALRISQAVMPCNCWAHILPEPLGTCLSGSPGLRPCGLCWGSPWQRLLAGVTVLPGPQPVAAFGVSLGGVSRLLSHLVALVEQDPRIEVFALCAALSALPLPSPALGSAPGARPTGMDSAPFSQPASPLPPHRGLPWNPCLCPLLHQHLTCPPFVPSLSSSNCRCHY